MTCYGIGNLEKLLGVKAHVIRYWEKEIPLIQSRKDLSGRRVYAKRDLLIFFRLKYLLYDRRFTIEGARDQLFREITGRDDAGGDSVAAAGAEKPSSTQLPAQNLKAHIEALRSELLDLYFLVHDPASPAKRTGEDQDPL
ncbi:MAG: MerR family transcriptional regulator [Treponema sp.]|jgi:DNA-binding transcriptional MerR regulator|nr:MerR family transcriptional regulator [Treponema sp.]